RVDCSFMTGSFFRSSVFKERSISLFLPLGEASASLAATRTILSCSVVPVNSFLFFLVSASDPAGQADLAATDINLPRTPSFVNTFFGFYLSPH
ncbi:hypothetical protein ACFQ40_18430, partial [Kroppenstedtia eburnea]|uniref:hypothetical protein n=1 Tax=Kroppenstedtia eburnea TaxID=714067 RepID=UPI00362D7087